MTSLQTVTIADYKVGSRLVPDGRISFAHLLGGRLSHEDVAICAYVKALRYGSVVLLLLLLCRCYPKYSTVIIAAVILVRPRL